MPGKNDVITLIGVGDVDVTVTSVGAESHFDLTRDILQAADVTFGQLEFPLGNSGARQLGTGPGTSDMIGVPKDPKNGARILGEAGFNVMCAASNHIMDFGEESLFETMDALASETDIKLIGVGHNLEESHEPAIIDCKGTRIGFLGYCSVIDREQMAHYFTTPMGKVFTRGGVAPLRAQTAYAMVDWHPGAPPRVVSSCIKDDLDYMIEDIKKLRPQVDILVVSQHWGVHHFPGLVADYQVEAAHACVDAGTDLIIGGHPHQIRGVEFYKGVPTYYGLGNFINPMADLGGDDHDDPKTFMIKIDIADKKISRVAAIPMWFNYKDLTPEPLKRSDPRADEIMEAFVWACENNTPGPGKLNRSKRGFPPFDTKFAWDGDEIVMTPNS